MYNGIQWNSTLIYEEKSVCNMNIVGEQIEFKDQ